MKYLGLIVALNGLFVFCAAHAAHVQITSEAVTKSVQPLLAIATLFQHWVA